LRERKQERESMRLGRGRSSLPAERGALCWLNPGIMTRASRRQKAEA